MYARTIYISAAAVLALGSLASCSNDDATSPTDDENTPISATASVAQATGSVSRGGAIDFKGFGLSNLTLYYQAKGSDTWSKFLVPDGTNQTGMLPDNATEEETGQYLGTYNYITDADANSFDFATGYKDDDANNATAPHLFWQKVNAAKTLYLTVKRQESDMPEGTLDELWASAEGNRTDLTFNLKSRYAKFTLTVNAVSDIMPDKFMATLKAYKAATADIITQQAIPASAETEEVTLIAKATEGTAKTQTLENTIYVIPQALEEDKNNILTLTYGGTEYPIDLSKVKVKYTTDESEAAFAFNAGEHITLKVTLTIATALTPGTVTVTGFATDATQHNFDGTSTPKD